MSRSKTTFIVASPVPVPSVTRGGRCGRRTSATGAFTDGYITSRSEGMSVAKSIALSRSGARDDPTPRQNIPESHHWNIAWLRKSSATPRPRSVARVVPGRLFCRRFIHSGMVGIAGGSTRGTQALCACERTAPNMLSVMPVAVTSASCEGSPAARRKLPLARTPGEIDPRSAPKLPPSSSPRSDGTGVLSM